jgi:hypothetical protein
MKGGSGKVECKYPLSPSTKKEEWKRKGRSRVN